MVGVTNGKIQKTRTAEDIKTDSEFDMNEAQPPAKTQSAKSVSIPILPAVVGARNITVRTCGSFFMCLQANGGA